MSPTNVEQLHHSIPSTASSQNSGSSCGQLSYDNLRRRHDTTRPAGYEMGAAPFVQVPDVASGSGPSIAGSGYVTSNPLPTSPQQTRAGASATMAPLSSCSRTILKPQ